MQQPVCEKVSWIDYLESRSSHEFGRLLWTALSSLGKLVCGTPHNGGRGGRGGGMTWLPFSGGEGGLVDVLSGRGACLIDNWIGRRWKDRGTPTIAYINGSSLRGSGMYALQGRGDRRKRNRSSDWWRQGSVQRWEGGSTMPDGARMEIATLGLSV